MLLEPAQQTCIAIAVSAVLFSITILKYSRFKGWKTILFYGSLLGMYLDLILLSDIDRSGGILFLFTALTSVAGVMQLSDD